MSLRARLLLVLAVLLGAGLLVADVVTYTALRSQLFKRVDASLDSNAEVVAGTIGRGPGGIDRLAGLGVLTPGTYIEIRRGTTVLLHGTITRRGETAPTPRLPI